MKKLLLVCILSGVMFAQNVAVEQQEKQKDDTVVVNKTPKAVTGIIKEFYHNGKVRSEISYKGDKLDGIRKEYYETGKLIVQIPYKDGILNGVLKVYYRSGKLEFEIPFKNNILEGMFIEYYSTGKLKSETPYSDGKKEGIGKVYNATGKARKVLFRDGTFNGTIKIHSETDTVLIEITIENGKVTKIL